MTPHGLLGRPPRPTFRDRMLDWRDRLVASPRFQRWAAAFPPTRPIANAQARGLFDLAAGFVYSQVLAAAVKLDLFALLAEGPATVAELAARTGLPRPGMERLVAAALSLGLVQARSGGRYGLGLRGAALLGNPGIGEMIAHHDLFYADLADPLSLLAGERQTRLAAFWPYAGTDAGSGLPAAAVGAYSRLMAASQGLVADDILAALPLSGVRRLMDVGGGDGAFLARAADRWPHLEVTLFDLPAVAALAEARFAAAGLSHRAAAVGGSFRSGPLPGGADAISLVRVIHDHDNDVVAALLRACREALAPGERLILAEPMAGTRGAERVGDAYFGFYLMAMGSGRARTPARLKECLQEAGFGRIRTIRTRRPLLTGLIVADAGKITRVET